ncbi:DUF3060 domain-containing protein [Mycobacterium kubicae]|uniref:DUF3060 domain-containing protein n=1 Tax=Mycobacterium kubicae TaxID=120959 RepID=UPI0008018D68|nr:DUF3060 domain-containing protein [Mycobacterium kubicae]OBK50435.1 hypothetical protein A5657_20315 [Mycobacterium kubicae]
MTGKAGDSAMDPDDPEQYIRNLEHRAGQPLGPSSQPPNPDNDSLVRWLRGAAGYLNTPSRRRVMVFAAAAVIAIALFVAYSHHKTTVHGNLVMINSGAKDTIDCNDGSVKLDGDNNTYTITGHCRRLEVFGSANHVTVDSADTIDIFGDDNEVTYHSGYPRINKTGNNDTVFQRPNGR